jgi:hypothetical protein
VETIINKEFFLQYRSQAKVCNFLQNKSRIMYKNIPDNLKKMFKDKLNEIIQKPPISQPHHANQPITPNHHDPNNINMMWKHIKDSMIKIKNSDLLKEFKKKQIPLTQNQHLEFLLEIRQMSNTISVLRNLYAQFNMKRINRYQERNTTTNKDRIQNDKDTIWHSYWSNYNLVK